MNLGREGLFFLEVGMKTLLGLFSITLSHSVKASEVAKAALQWCPAPPQLHSTMAQQWMRQQTAWHVETSSTVKSVVTASNYLFTASDSDSCKVFFYDACSLNINLQNAMAHLLICLRLDSCLCASCAFHNAIKNLLPALNDFVIYWLAHLSSLQLAKLYLFLLYISGGK